MALLVGDTHTTFADDFAVSDGYLDALKFTAAETGSVSQIDAYLHCNTGFTVEVGLYASAGSVPGALLTSGSGTFAGGAGFSWCSITGLSVSVVSGTDYWFGIVASTPGVAIGKVNGTGILDVEPDDPHASLPDPWPAGTYSTYDLEQVGLRALGTIGGGGGGSTSINTGLEFHLTGIIGGSTSSPTPAPYYGRIADPQAGEVVIPLNDSRTASVTVSAYDPVVETLAGLTQVPYAVHLKAYYNGRLVFWGPVKVLGGDFVAGTVRLDAVDMSLRLIKHFIREGDVTLEGTVDATTGEGSLPISHIGMRLLRDAGDTLSFPPLGIDDGVNTYAPETVGILGVRRGDQVWNTITQMQQALGPDFELEPRDDADGFYCQLNTYDRQGVDVSPNVQMHLGTGRQNIESLSFVEGEEYVNLAHVLDKDLEYRQTRSNGTAITRTGPYIYWDATDFDTSHTTEADARDVLDARADDILDAYSDPLVALNLTLFPDAPGGYRYLDDYGVGDTIGVAGRVGFLELPEAPYRVMKVTLTKDGENDQQSLEVVADRTIEIAGDDT
jgi:hypothetical protein